MELYKSWLFSIEPNLNGVGTGMSITISNLYLIHMVHIFISVYLPSPPHWIINLIFHGKLSSKLWSIMHDRVMDMEY